VGGLGQHSPNGTFGMGYYCGKPANILKNSSRFSTLTIATNDNTVDSAVDIKAICGTRWKVEQYHREGKQMLGIEKCQCRKARAQKNHIGCVILAWHCLTQFAKTLKTNIYALKNGFLSNYMKEALKSPSIPWILLNFKP
jgi:hypothetical protein